MTMPGLQPYPCGRYVKDIVVYRGLKVFISDNFPVAIPGQP